MGCNWPARTGRALPPVVGASFRSFASPQAAKLIPSTVPLLPSRHCDSRAEVARQSRRSFFPARFIRHRRRFAGKLSPPNPLRSRWRLCRLTDAACPPGGTPANNGGGKPPPYSAWQFPRQPGFYQTGDHRSPLRTARRGRRAPRRRHKLRIARFAASGKARSLHCASSPHDDHSVGSPRGPIRRADDIRPYRAG